jgi:TatD DNase family protein
MTNVDRDQSGGAAMRVGSRSVMAERVPVFGYTLRGNRYLNVTNRCSLRCTFCPKFNDNWTVQDYALRLTREPTVDEMVEAVDNPPQYREVVFCGLGEPTLRLYDVLEAATRLRKLGARWIRINTDGLANLVHQRDVTPDLEKIIDSVSVSLNAQDAATYERHCRPMEPGSYEAMLDFVRRVREFVPDVSVSAIDGLEGVDIEACAALAARLGVRFRRRVLGKVG